MGFRSWEKDYCHMGRYHDFNSATRLLRRLWWQFRTYTRLRRWFLRSGKRREAVKWREGRSTKYDIRHYLFVLLIRCDRLFAVTFHTVNVAVIFAVVWLPPKVESLPWAHRERRHQPVGEPTATIGRRVKYNIFLVQIYPHIHTPIPTSHTHTQMCNTHTDLRYYWL